MQVEKQVSRAMIQQDEFAEELDAVHEGEEGHTRWTDRLVLFLRAMSVLSFLKGLFHWALICGFIVGADGSFETRPAAWQTATVFFAVIDLVAAVGLWLAAAWGAVVWLTAVVSMGAVELLFPRVFGGSVAVMLVELGLMLVYLGLAFQSARERPP